VGAGDRFAGGSFRSRNPVVLGRGSIMHSAQNHLSTILHQKSGSFRSRNPVVLGRGSIPHLLVPIDIFLIFDGLIFFNLSFLIFNILLK
jgi:hypothetical protein